MMASEQTAATRRSALLQESRMRLGLLPSETACRMQAAARAAGPRRFLSAREPHGLSAGQNTCGNISVPRALG